MIQRYFRADESVSESVRRSLDEAWGLPSSGQKTCFSPAGMAPRDADGKVLLAVDSEFCDYEAVSAVLPTLLSSGDVEELTSEEYFSAIALPDTE